MDANRFDRLSRFLFASPSRRSVLGLATGGGLGALLPLAKREVAAKRKKKRKKCKCGTVNCPAGSKNCDGACVPNDACCPACTSGFTCLSNGSCGRACSGGSCPSSCGICNSNVEGQAYCIAQGQCEIAGQDCTTMADCPQGYQCQLSSCPPSGTRCMPLCTS
jgi:hypothetical protein